MSYVVTQPCCADASCVVACPVNCIHPAPDEPGFAEAEMVYIDPRSCVGCGACVTACPVGAIKPDTALSESERPFAALNAEYYEVFGHAERRPVAKVPRQRRLTRPGRYRVAIVGAGPAGLYAADELLRHPEISVDVFDRLPTPYGLARTGVAPDHVGTRRVTELFRAIESQPGFRYVLGVEVGADVTHDQLASRYHAVVYAVGAAHDRRLAVPGEDLEGSVSATALTGWYNGHPDHQDLSVPLDHERVVVVGNGNVALDVARVLTADPESLAGTAIARLPWAALASSAVREVVVLGRRGPAQAAFTVPELVGLAALADVDVVVDDGGLGLDEPGEGARILRELAARPVRGRERRIVLRFGAAPTRVLGEDHVTGVELVRTRLRYDGGRAVAEPTEEHETLDAGLVVRAIGFRGRPVPDLPWDEVTATVPSDHGRVRPGTYVVGWAKRGPTGFLGTNKSCAAETVERLLDDLDSGLPEPSTVPGPLPGAVGLDGWRAIDAEERRRGRAQGRLAATIVDVDELRRVATAGLGGDEGVQYPGGSRWSRRAKGSAHT